MAGCISPVLMGTTQEVKECFCVFDMNEVSSLSAGEEVVHLCVSAIVFLCVWIERICSRLYVFLSGTEPRCCKMLQSFLYRTEQHI